MILEFSVDEQKVTQNEDTIVVNHSQNYLSLKFNFTENSIWEDLLKRVLFFSKKRVYNKYLDENNEVIVPHEVLGDDYFKFTLYGVKDEQRVTTNIITLYLDDSGYTEHSYDPDPDTPGVIDEILMKLENTVEMEVIFEDGTHGVYDVVVK